MTVFNELHTHFSDISLLNARDIDDATPLHFAAKSGNIHGVQRLLQLGADINAKTKRGETPWVFALQAIDTALNYDPVSGELHSVQIDSEEVISSMIREWSWRDRVRQSVTLGRVLESVGKQRQRTNDSGFRTRREEPTEILSLIAIMLYLEHKGAKLA